MQKQVLIAEPLDVIRAGLRAIFLEDPRVSDIHEAANEDGLRAQLQSNSINLVIVNQALITNNVVLPLGNFIILTTSPDLIGLKHAYEMGARGYLSANISADLLRTMLNLSRGAFLIEPALTPWIMKCLCGSKNYFIRDELLTPREREIVHLLREGHNKTSIAQQLTISEATLKTHIKNIARKRDDAMLVKTGTR